MKIFRIVNQIFFGVILTLLLLSILNKIFLPIKEPHHFEVITEFDVLKLFSPFAIFFFLSIFTKKEIIKNIAIIIVSFLNLFVIAWIIGCIFV
jgi:hypothetical protein